MSYPNHWQYEPLAKQRRQEISSVEEKARLLKKAGTSSPSLMDCIIDTLRNVLNLRKQHFPNHPSGAPRTDQSASNKLSQEARRDSAHNE